MGNTINPHIEGAQKTGACNLAKQKLPEFPAALLSLNKNLRTLDVSQNKIPSIPPAIGSFQVLKSLNLSSNKLSRIPDEVGQLKKLETLNVCHNSLQELPATLSNLKALLKLDASFNLVRDFPCQIGGLKHLDMIDLSHNRIKTVPEGVRTVEAIEINLNQNQIASLSESVAECPRLKVLRLEENCLQLNALTPKLLKESKISTLVLDGNVFEMKQFHDVDGYDEYQERYTAAKKKMN